MCSMMEFIGWEANPNLVLFAHRESMKAGFRNMSLLLTSV
jgi:hypothetical protein